MVYNYEFLTPKFVLINEGESNRKLPKIFAGKTKKSCMRWFNKKRPDAMC